VLEPAYDLTSSGEVTSPPTRPTYYYIGSATGNETLAKRLRDKFRNMLAVSVPGWKTAVSDVLRKPLSD
jgi:hypothetical protein